MRFLVLYASVVEEFVVPISHNFLLVLGSYRTVRVFLSGSDLFATLFQISLCKFGCLTHL